MKKLITNVSCKSIIKTILLIMLLSTTGLNQINAQGVINEVVIYSLTESTTSGTMSFSPQWWSQGWAYIDYNSDGDFSDAGETIATWGWGSGPWSFTVTPPSGSAGTRTLRLQASGGYKDFSIVITGTGPKPVISNPTSANTMPTSATLGGNIISIGSSTVIERGVYWSTTNGFADGTGTKVSEFGTYGTGVFAVDITGLTPSTTYYYKAFATNSDGTSYTSQGTFDNLPKNYYYSGNGNWDNLANWKIGSCGGTAATSLPTKYDNIFVNCSWGGSNLTINVAGKECNNLTVGEDCDFIMNGNSFTVNGNLSILNQGDLPVGNGNLNILGNYTTDGGDTYININGSGNVTIGGNITPGTNWGTYAFSCPGTGYLMMNGTSKTFTVNNNLTIKYFKLGSSTLTKAGGGSLTLTTYDKNCFTSMSGTYSATTTIECSLVGANAGSNKTGCQSGANIGIGGAPTATGGTGPYTYAWSGSPGAPSISDNSVANPTVSPTLSGVFTYTVTVTDAVADTTTDDMVVTINATPTATNNGPKCIGTTITFNATPNGATTYNWAGPSGYNIANNQTPTRGSLIAGHAGTYTVSITTNGQICTATTSVVVNALPTITTTAQYSSICTGESTNLTASGGSTYVWNNSNTDAIISVSPVVNTTYTVTGTNANSCSNTSTVSVVLISTATASNNGPKCIGTSLSVDVNPTGTSYSWVGPNAYTSTAKTPTVSGSVTALMSGAYTVTVTYASGCTQTASTNVIINSVPTASITVDNNGSICASVGTPVQLTATGGVSYNWSGGLGSGNIKSVSPITNTTYTVTITDASTCTATATQLIRYKTAGPNRTHSGAGVNITASGGSAYVWNTSETNATINVAPPIIEQYTVTIDDGLPGSCIDDVQVEYVACVATTYYSISSGNSTSPATWNSAIDGSGCNPILTQLTNGSCNLIIQSGHTISMNGDISINTLTVNAGGVLNSDVTGVHSLTVLGNIVNNGTITLYNSSGNYTNTIFNGNTILSGSSIIFGGIIINATKSLHIGTSFHTVKNDFVNNGSFTHNNRGLTFSGDAQSITGNTIFYDVLFSNNTKTLNSNVTVTNSLTISASTTVNATGDLTTKTTANSGLVDISNGGVFTVSGGTWTQNNGSTLKLGCSHSMGTMNAGTATNYVYYNCQTPNVTIDLIDCNYNKLIINTIDSTTTVRWNGASARDVNSINVTSGKFLCNTVDIRNLTSLTVNGSQSVMVYNNSTCDGSYPINVTNGGILRSGTYAGGAIFKNVNGLNVTNNGSFLNSGQINFGSASDINITSGGRVINTVGSRFGENGTGEVKGLVNINGGILEIGGYSGNFERGIIIDGGGTFLVKATSSAIPIQGEVGIIKAIPGHADKSLWLKDGAFTVELGADVDRFEALMRIDGGVLTYNGSNEMTGPGIKGMVQTGGVTNWCSTTIPLILGDGDVIISGGDMNVLCGEVEVKNVLMNITGEGSLNVDAGSILAMRWGGTGLVVSGNADVTNNGTIKYADDALNNCNMTITSSGTFYNNGVLQPATHLDKNFTMNNPDGVFINNGYINMSNFVLTDGHYYNFCKINAQTYKQDAGHIYGTKPSDDHVGQFYIATTSQWNAGTFGTNSSEYTQLNFFDAGTPVDKWDTKCAGCTAGSGVQYNSGVLPVSDCSDLILPVELLYFISECKANYIKLSWATASETNNDYFIIEAAKDAILFDLLHILNGAGNSIKIVHYNYNVQSHDYNYFRLKQVDYDGNYTYSNIIFENCNTKFDMLYNMYDNQIVFNTYIYDAVLTDVLGRRINTHINGNTIIVEEYCKGVYFLRINNILLKIIL